MVIFLAPGFEETEAITTIDLLRRAGIEVLSVAVGTSLEVESAHHVVIKADKLLSEIGKNEISEGVILPGGMPGTTNLWNSEKVRALTLQAYQEDALVAAICAAPLILGRLGIIEGHEAICFPSFEPELKGAALSKKTTVADGNIITSTGVQSAIEFSLEIIRYLRGKEKSEEVGKQIYVR